MYGEPIFIDFRSDFTYSCSTNERAKAIKYMTSNKTDWEDYRVDSTGFPQDLSILKRIKKSKGGRDNTYDESEEKRE